METHWTDGRLDQLNDRVEELGKRTERGFVEFRTEMQSGFERIEQLIERMDAKAERRFEQIDERFEQVDQRFQQIDERFAQIDKRFVGVEGRLIKVEVRLEDLGERSGRVERRLDGLIYSIIGLGASMFVAVSGLVAAQFINY